MLLGGRQIEILAREPFGESDITCTGMCLHALQSRDARCDRSDLSVSFARHALPRDRLQELPCGEAARVTCRTPCRQNVIRPTFCRRRRLSSPRRGIANRNCVNARATIPHRRNAPQDIQGHRRRRPEPLLPGSQRR
jgi:hypothetical protein